MHRVLAIVVWFTLTAVPAAAEKRIALVIGNNDYPSLTAEEQLKRAVNDANAIGDALESLGFEVVRGEILSRGAMLSSLISAADKIEPGDIGFFFFAGHGVSIDGSNYLLPTDIPAASSGAEDLIKLSAVSEATVIETLKSRGAGVAVVVLDACRNNPFSQGGTRAFGDATRGLSRPPSVQPQGVFGLYSAGFGEQALDGLGEDDASPNSIFTRVLAPALTEPGQSLLDIAYRVNDEVARLADSVGHEQNPAYYDQARARDVFLAERTEESEVAAAPVEEPAARDNTPQAPADPCASARLHFDAARAIGRIAALEDHIAKFPSCEFAQLAEMLIETMRSETPDQTEEQVAALPDATATAEASESDSISVLGMSLTAITDSTRQEFGIGDDLMGAIVEAVEPQSQAEAEGIVPGTVIIEVGNEPVASPDDVVRRIEQLAGDERGAIVLRLMQLDGDAPFIALQLPTNEQPVEPQSSEGAATLHGPETVDHVGSGIALLGMTLSPLTDANRATFGIGSDVTGAVVTAVEANSEAEREGITPGTVITAVGNTLITTPAEILTQIDHLRSLGREAVPLKLFGSQGFPFVGLQLSAGDSAGAVSNADPCLRLPRP